MKAAGIRENRPKANNDKFNPSYKFSEKKIPQDNEIYQEDETLKDKAKIKGKEEKKPKRNFFLKLIPEKILKADLPKWRSAGGTFIMLAAIFLLIALVSHLIYFGSLDQSAVEIFSEQNAENNGGYFGAFFAKYLITDGFGLPALALPFYLFLCGYALSENKHVGLLKRTFPFLLFGLYWGATVLAYLKIVFDLPFLDLGGGVGLSINEWISFYIGNFGTGLFIIFSFLLFINYHIKEQVGLFGFVGSFLAKYEDKAPAPNTFTQPEKEEENKPLNETFISSDLRDNETDDGFIITVKRTERRIPVEEFELEEEDENKDDEPEMISENLPDEITENMLKDVITAAPPEKQYDDFAPEAGLSLHPEELEPEFDLSEPEGLPTGSVEFIIERPAPEKIVQPTENKEYKENPVQTDEFLPVFELQSDFKSDFHLPFDPEEDWQPAVFAPSGDPGGIQFLPPPTVKTENEPEPEHRGLLFQFPAQEELFSVPENLELIIERVSEPSDEVDFPVLELYDTEKEEMIYISKEQKPYDPKLDLSNFQNPTIDLLEVYENSAQIEINREELEDNKNRIVRTLSNYGIEITSIKASIGPTVTLYEIVPAAGVRISKIKNLEDDIALGLAALGIRIIAPMPGKGTIGIEIPNSKPEMVSFRNVVATEKFQHTKAALPIGLGRTISNEVYVLDLSKLPHLLVAGATGQGKSVGLNTIIASILYKKHPSEVKFVLIDPKKVELSLYQALEYHYLAKLPNMEDAIITDNKDVVHVLNSLCKEMDDRYKLLQHARVRNIEEYNFKFTERKLNPENGHKFLPFIILVIDELADLMFTAGKEIEMPIARLAQLARAVGIHLVVATQRPSVNVITGLIKANFPARMSYRVTQKIDSRTILDANGAEQLIGRGDLLLMKDNELIRIQNAFIDTSEVEKVVDFIAKQRGYSQPYLLPEVSDGNDDDNGSNDLSDRDPLFEEAARLLVNLNSGSTSSIQQHMKIGYNRAARIMLQLEKAGIVSSPAGGNKPREILVRNLYDLEKFL